MSRFSFSAFTISAAMRRLSLFSLYHQPKFTSAVSTTTARETTSRLGPEPLTSGTATVRLPRLDFGTLSRLMRIIGLQNSLGPNPQPRPIGPRSHPPPEHSPAARPRAG